MLKVLQIFTWSWLLAGTSFTAHTESNQQLASAIAKRPHLERFLQTMIQYYVDIELRVWQEKSGQTLSEAKKQQITGVYFYLLKDPIRDIFASCSDDELDDFQRSYTQNNMQNFLVYFSSFIEDFERARAKFDVSFFCWTKGPPLPDNILGTILKNNAQLIIKNNTDRLLGENTIYQTSYSVYEYLLMNYPDEHDAFERVQNNYTEIHHRIGETFYDIKKTLKNILEKLE